MKRFGRIIFHVSAAMSAVLIVAVVWISIAGAMGHEVHLGDVWFDTESDRLVVHNYWISNRGIIVGISSSNLPAGPTGLHFELAGIGFDNVRDAPRLGGNWWTLNVSYWWLIPMLMPAIAFVARRLFAPVSVPGICFHCGYDLRATPDRCPECGNSVADGARPRSAILLSKFLRVITYVVLLYLCCLVMMAIHELGHVLHCWLSGRRVEHVEFGFLEFSRTDLSVNPHPQFVGWGGPLWGSVLPLIAYRIASAARSRLRKFFCFFAGFCLIVNGGYIGLGWIDGVGDAGTLLRHGAPVWSLVVSGWIALLGGLLLWHRLGPLRKIHQ